MPEFWKETLADAFENGKMFCCESHLLLLLEAFEKHLLAEPPDAAVKLHHVPVLQANGKINPVILLLADFKKTAAELGDVRGLNSSVRSYNLNLLHIQIRYRII